MKAKNFFSPALMAGVLIFLLMPLNAIAQKDKPQKAAKEEKVFIPKEIREVLQEGLTSKQGRQDFPFNISRSLFLPAQQNFHAVFFLNIKNSALGYSTMSAVVPEKEKSKEKSESIAEVSPAQEAGRLEAKFNVFLQFNRLDEDTGPQVFKEVYVPASIQVDEAGFDAEKEDMYTFGYPLPSGHYLLAVAVTSLDLKQIGTAYYEFTLPDASQFSKAIDTTPMFFLKSFEKIDAPETRTLIHKGYFTYSVLKIVPNIEKVFAVGENIDIFFYIFGAQQNEQQQYAIDINFEVKKDEEAAIRWAPQTYNSPLVSQPLPMKQTVIIKSQAGEKTEERDLAPGTYTLVIAIKDTVSGNGVTKTLEIEVR